MIEFIKILELEKRLWDVPEPLFCARGGFTLLLYYFYIELLRFTFTYKNSNVFSMLIWFSSFYW